MKNIFVGIILILFLKFAAYSSTAAPTPTGLGGQAALWLPDENSEINEVISALEENKNAKLTVSVFSIPANMEQRIKILENENRIEFAMRLPYDPVLPLFYYPSSDSVLWENKPSTASLTDNPYFFMLRMADAKEKFQKNFKKTPSGFSNPPGGILYDYIPIAKSLGIKWIAAGPFASAYEAVVSSGIYIAPFSIFKSTEAVETGDKRTIFTVIDETLDKKTGIDSRKLLLSLLSDPDKAPSLTVSEALEVADSTEIPPAQLSAYFMPWSENYNFWARQKQQDAALTVLKKVRIDISGHLNSIYGDVSVAKNLFEEFYAAESGPKLLALSDTDVSAVGEAEHEIQTALVNVYRLMEKNPPSWLFTSFSEMQTWTADREEVKISSGPDYILLQNTLQPPALPEHLPKLPRSADPAKIWKLEAIKVQWNDSDIIVSIKPSQIEPRWNPDGISRAVIDLYIDINQRVKAGFSKPLENRDGKFFPTDAWEYAITADTRKAELFMASSLKTKKLETFGPTTGGGEILIKIPRTAMKGNPALWGYAAMIMSPAGKNFHITDMLCSSVEKGYIYSLRIPRK